jgi:hypothetical protein
LIEFESVSSKVSVGRSVLFSAAAACVLGCGGAEGASPSSLEPVEEPDEAMEVPGGATPEAPVNDPPGTEPETPVMPPVDMMLPDTSGDDTDRCAPGAGASGSPRTIPEAIELINSLPKPTSLACFIQSLDRPLTLFMTESYQSLQPATGPESPRTFVLRDDLEMSIVFDGEASNTLEFGYLTSSSRSIKAEILFPIRTNVRESTLFDRIQASPQTTVCGSCHVAEVLRDFPGFPNGVFESDVYEPFDIFEVELESMKAEAAACDESAEPYRCELLSAVFDHGETVQGRVKGSDE